MQRNARQAVMCCSGLRKVDGMPISDQYNTNITRHRASTSMYSLTFCVRVTSWTYNTPQYGRNGTAHAAGASILSWARGVGMRSARHCVRRVVRITAGFCHAFLVLS